MGQEGLHDNWQEDWKYINIIYTHYLYTVQQYFKGERTQMPRLY